MHEGGVFQYKKGKDESTGYESFWGKLNPLVDINLPNFGTESFFVNGPVQDIPITHGMLNPGESHLLVH